MTREESERFEYPPEDPSNSARLFLAAGLVGLGFQSAFQFREILFDGI